MVERPDSSEYAPFFAGYIASVDGTDLLAVLDTQTPALREFAAAVGADRETHRYAEGKWSVREVVGHMIDGERIFGYRAYTIARSDRPALPAFDDHAYVAAGRYNERPLADLVEEFAAVRAANRLLFGSFTDDDWRRLGTTNERTTSVRALGYITAGHVAHHLGVLRDRYLA